MTNFMTESPKWNTAAGVASNTALVCTMLCTGVGNGCTIMLCTGIGNGCTTTLCTGVGKWLHHHATCRCTETAAPPHYIQVLGMVAPHYIQVLGNGCTTMLYAGVGKWLRHLIQHGVNLRVLPKECSQTVMVVDPAQPEIHVSGLTDTFK